MRFFARWLRRIAQLLDPQPTLWSATRRCQHEYVLEQGKHIYCLHCGHRHTLLQPVELKKTDPVATVILPTAPHALMQAYRRNQPLEPLVQIKHSR